GRTPHLRWHASISLSICISVTSFIVAVACSSAHSAPVLTVAEYAVTFTPASVSTPPPERSPRLPSFAPPPPTITATRVPPTPTATLTPFPPPAALAPSPGRPNWSAGLLLQPLRHGDATLHAVYLTFDDGYGYPDQI